MDITLGWDECLLSEEYIMNWFLAEESSVSFQKNTPLTDSWQKNFFLVDKTSILLTRIRREILLIGILNLRRRPTILSLNGYHLKRRAVLPLQKNTLLTSSWRKNFVLMGKKLDFSWQESGMHELLPMRFLTLGEDLQFFPQEPYFFSSEL